MKFNLECGKCLTSYNKSDEKFVKYFNNAHE